MNTKRQKGIALVSVMAAIAIITAIISALAYRQHIDIGIQGYAIQKNRAILDVLAIENLAAATLLNPRRDTDSPQYDYYDESWAEPVEDLELNGGTVKFMIFDAQAKFNINNLNIGGNNRRHAIEMLKNIFTALELNDGKIYQEVTNWVSPDGDIRGKDRLYLAENENFNKYHFSNTPMISANELRLMVSLRELEELPDILIEMDDYVAFLPTINELVKINVNTASEVMLLEVVKYFGGEGSFLSITNGRPFANVNSFCRFMKKNRDICARFFDVKSSYFYVYAIVEAGDNRVYSKSLLRVVGDDARVIVRELKVI